MEVEKLDDGLWRWTSRIDDGPDAVGRLGGGVLIAVTSDEKRTRANELAERYTAPVWTPTSTTPPPPGLHVIAAPGNGDLLFEVVDLGLELARTFARPEQPLSVKAAVAEPFVLA